VFLILSHYFRPRLIFISFNGYLFSIIFICKTIILSFTFAGLNNQIQRNRNFMAARSDLFVSPDYYQLDDLLTEEQKHIREAVRNYVKKEISPIIEDFAQRSEFPQQIVKQLGDLGCFGPTIPAQYGGGGTRLYQLWFDDAGTGAG
jgi:hypothetical protein